MTTTFKRAVKIDLFDKDGNPWKMKGIVNEENTKEYFNTVSDGYNIVQHEEVVGLVEEALKDKNLKASKVIEPLNDGARLHIELTFPEITLDIENNGQQVALRCTYDNSYDGTTGLRLEVGAKSPYGEGFLWVGGLVKALEDNYYHRHTKGVNVAEFEKKLDKGINSFQTKIKEHFLQMLKTPVTNNQAITFLEESEEIKGITKKYLETIQGEVKKATIKNKWQLYCVICDVISKEASSIDVRDRQLSLLVSRLHKVFKSNDKVIESPEEGLTLKQVVDEKKIVDAINEVSQAVKEQKNIEKVKEVIQAVKDSKLPEGLIGLTLIKNENVTIPSKLTIEKKAKRKFVVLQGGTEIKTFKKYDQAAKFVKQAS